MKKFMVYLKGKFHGTRSEAMALIFCCYFRSLMIYHMTPLYAAGAVTEKELFMMETDMKKKGFGLPGDVTAEAISKLCTPQIIPTPKLIAQLGTKLRNKVAEAKRAKVKKHIEILIDTTEQ